jgi:hypothetical protein
MRFKFAKFIYKTRMRGIGNYSVFLDDKEGVENIWVGSRVVLVCLKIFLIGKELILIFWVRFCVRVAISFRLTCAQYTLSDEQCMNNAGESGFPYALRRSIKIQRPRIYRRRGTLSGRCLSAHFVL